MRPPHYDRRPLYTDGVGYGWVGYGIFDEWPSACITILVYKSGAPVMNDLTKPAVSTCPGCGLRVTSYWMKDNTGCVSRPEYILVAHWVYHSPCWDKQVANYNPERDTTKLMPYMDSKLEDSGQ